MMKMTRKLYFSSAHRYCIEDWSEEKNRQLFGACYNPNGHGHDYILNVTVKGEIEKDSGIIVNITEVDKTTKEFLSSTLDGKFLNYEVEYFKNHLPTTENIATFIWNSIDGELPQCKLDKIQVIENPYLLTEKEEAELVKLTRKYHFCTAHRLHSETLSKEENIALFGKCNNVYGHGHNYYLDVTVKGVPDPVTGMICDLGKLDQLVNDSVLAKFDHKHLNLDTEEFKALNPTSENVAIVIWNLLYPCIPNLDKVGLWETEKNYFEYGGEGE
ncbi:6-carboxytetrahydropterin synthase [Fictibacillus enclensis]|uniref:6-carboxytetrahydropterin synthase n=1 Tax=Fictibacillus enclensis TaxID=1017270 RepID=UPI0025A29DC1|nr:6-carboxytetrahydropterin synthase [Fictibacillus enclensis]MDM5335757.1 6-carboxytetrahydropterin synthase [Fictibacillus enclensis]